MILLRAPHAAELQLRCHLLLHASSLSDCIGITSTLGSNPQAQVNDSLRQDAFLLLISIAHGPAAAQQQYSL